MPEGLDLGNGTITDPIYDDPDRPPEPSREAPKGWAWKRQAGRWEPRQRGAVIWTPDVSAGHGTQRDAAAPVAGPAGHETAGGYQRDPDPSWTREPDDQQKPGNISDEKLKWSDIPIEAKDNAASIAGMLGIPLLAFAQAADPYCGSALASNYENIIDHALPLILRSKKAVKFLTSEDSDWLLWLGLGQALWPVATAVYRHHVAHTVEVVRDESGRPFARERQRQEGHGDHLTPPVQPEYRYAA